MATETAGKPAEIEVDVDYWKLVYASYSGASIADRQSVTRPFSYNGHPPVATGLGVHRADCWELRPPFLYYGVTKQYGDKDRSIGYEGMEVTWGGKLYIMTNPITIVCKEGGA